MSQFHPAHNPKRCFCKIYANVIVPTTFVTKLSSLESFLLKISWAFLRHHDCYGPVHPVLLDLTTLTVHYEPIMSVVVLRMMDDVMLNAFNLQD